MDPDTLRDIAKQVGRLRAQGVEVALVIGGGNLFRGRTAAEAGMDRATADYAGMLATVINGLALQDALERRNVMTRTQSAIDIKAVAEPYILRRAIRHLEKGRVVIFVAGTGNPYMTTDTTAALRGVEMGADLLLMAKNNVDGVYTADPLKNPAATKFDRIEHIELLSRRLEVMDSTALSLCMENDLSIRVFDVFKPGSIERILQGDQIGTLISTQPVGAERS